MDADLEKSSAKTDVNVKRSVLFVVRTVYHCVVLVYYVTLNIFACRMLLNCLTHPEDKVRELIVYAVAFATNWNIIFQMLFVFLAVVYDALEWLNAHQGGKARRIKYFRDVIFCALVVPFTCFVCIMFWSIYSVDRELVFPKVFDEIVPWWFNHCVHTNIFVILIVEMILTPRRHPVDRRLELWLIGGFTVLYAIVYYCIYAFSGRWLYNVFALMTWWQIVLFQSAIFIFAFIYYWVQFPISRLIHKDTKVLKDPVEYCSDIDQNEINQFKCRTNLNFERTEL